MKQLLFLLMFSAGHVAAQKLHLSVSVRSQTSGQALPGASVQLLKTNAAGITDDDGNFFPERIRSGQYDLVIRYVGYLTVKKKVLISRDTTLTVSLMPFTTDLDEVTIDGQHTDFTDRPLSSLASFSTQQLRTVPSIDGEHDLARILTLTPGVKADNEANAGLFVRGGTSDQNLFLLDNVPLYKNSHFFGFLSPFNSDIIRQADLYRGGFPARFGGRLSSVLDVRLKSASMEALRVQGSTGILNSRLAIEVPLINDKLSVLLAGRRSYFDIFTRLFTGSGTTSSPDYHFYDLNGKLSARLGKQSQLQLFAYQDQDRLQAGAQNNLEDFRYDQRWTSRILGLSLTSILSRQVSNQLEINTSDYALNQQTTQIQQGIGTVYNFTNSLRTQTVRNSIDYTPFDSYKLRIGASGTCYRFQPGNLTFADKQQTVNKSIDSTDITELSSFLENEWKTSWLTIQAGLRYANYHTAGQQRYSFWEPRLMMAFKITPLASLIVTYSRMNQPIHLLTNPGFGIPVDLWFPTKGSIQPQSSHLISVGYQKTIAPATRHPLTFSAESYYKTLDHIITYQDGYSSQDFTTFKQNATRKWEDIMATGQGWSYGAELLLQKKQGRLTGWLGYTLSWTKHRFGALNQGNAFFARHDRRHDLSIVSSWQLNKRWLLNATWIYQTGQAVTLPQAVYSQTDYNFLTNQFGNSGPVLYAYGERNSYRMKAIHRMDVSIQRKTTHRWGVGQIDISVYNLYNRQNPYFYYLAPGNRVKAVSLLPIIPSLSYTFNIFTGPKTKQ
ncbi:TonB-dependent receptor [Arsenicibacter rosenii]|uniref:TonB-dependent receptor plug domain-containing protein n=1 Tax=Arsenicibacter rosenii TaxID=1750698 RepID=A0A1S2VES1_9BACT|nr:TonB-dependent receptor [Arsenicibacter rosenii]OIN57251.1 hypothetical protein BLX24_21095 [Arsenicibacter rosenii]